MAFLQNIFSLFYPNQCLGCNALLLKNENLICTHCSLDLPYTFHERNEQNETYTSFYGLVPIEFGLSLLYFRNEGITQKLIHQLKYKGKQEVGTFLGAIFSEEIKEVILKNQVTEIIPVPLHKKRLQQRGYNQVTTFCESLSKNIGIPFNEKLLYRTTYTETQTHKNKEARQYAKNIFDVNFSEVDHNKHFLLIDDVITTGATLEKCCKALLTVPNAKVSVLTMAYTIS